MTVTPYNFQKPGPLASALEHQFATWLKMVCAQASRQWRKELPAGFAMQFERCDFERSADALAALPEAVVGYRIALHERLNTLLVWPRTLILGICSGLQGAASTELPPDRDVTLIEESLFEFFLKDMLLPAYVETWSGRLPIRPVIGAREGNPRWAKAFPADETLAVTRFTLTGPFGSQEFRWLLPKKGLLECLWRETEAAEAAAAVRQRLEGAVRDLPVEVVVSLGAVDLRLSQLAQLRVGDVIVLNQRIDEPVRAHVADREKLSGWLGKLGNRQAVQIAGWER